MTAADVLVVGGGLGGLAAALRLAEGGARVVLLEALGYVGGCAATFERAGERFEAGATLVAGLGPGGFLRRWLAGHGALPALLPLDPVVHLRAPSLCLDVPADRDGLRRRFRALPGAPPGLEAFWQLQHRAARALWPLLEDPALLPPPRRATLGHHLRRLPDYLALLPWAARPLHEVVAAHGLTGWAPLAVYLDAVCQITLQTGAREASAPLALAALDYWFRGAAHVVGGVGRLAEAFAASLVRSGGVVHGSCRARALRRRRGAWEVQTARGTFHARHVVLNLLPRSVRELLPPLGQPLPRLRRLERAVEGGWGAVLQYLTLEAAPGTEAPAEHWQLVDVEGEPLVEGNAVFVSLGPAGGGDGPALRRATVSTHVALARLRGLGEGEQALRVGAIQARMTRTLARRLPLGGWRPLRSLPASPRTFARFTGRPGGAVGGPPRRAGWGAYRDLVPRPLLPGLWLVGDSVFPGQSALATAVGGWRTAERLLRTR